MPHLHVEYALIELRVNEGEELIWLDTTQMTNESTVMNVE
jgi:hypothetical protein